MKTDFDSVTRENCMKWQYLCPKEGVYHFEPGDRLISDQVTFEVEAE